MFIPAVQMMLALRDADSDVFRLNDPLCAVYVRCFEESFALNNH